MEAFHVQEGKNIKLATGTSLMADDRAIVSEAYAGDIIAVSYTHLDVYKRQPRRRCPARMPPPAMWWIPAASSSAALCSKSRPT